MPVFNFKYAVISFSFIYLLIGAGYMISMLSNVESLQKKYVYYLLFSLI